MRYDNWDVILFARDSLVPIQEFRTACYASQDNNGRQASTLSCYISSLPTSTPFRISVHSWAAPAKPSPIIESLRKPNQRVIYTAQVIVDGSRVFHGIYETGSKWPQEIVNEKRSINEPPVLPNQRGPFLEFPPFHQNVLMQSSWDPRDNSGRIKVLLSEQLVRKANNPGVLDFGVSNEIVCFAFQHASRDILEQAGIAWPIRNSLYMPSWTASRRTSGSGCVTPTYTKAHEFATEGVLAKPQPPTRPRTDPPPQFSQWTKPPGRGPRHGTWDTSIEDSFSGSAFDSMSMDSWSKITPSMNDLAMPDMYASGFTKPGDPWESMPPEYGQDDASRQKSTRQVVVTLREDQLGQLIEAMSPSKKVSVPSAQPQPPPKMASLSTRPSAAALARKVSYQDLTKVDKDNRPHAQDSRMPTVYPFVNKVRTPLPQINSWDSDVSMRDLSSVLSVARNSSPAHVPLAGGSVKSRKEGLVVHEVRHDQSLLPGFNPEKSVTLSQKDVNLPYSSSVAGTQEQSVHDHKATSSVDSTVQLERQLFSALGEELSGFNDEAIETASGLDDLSASKRKRQGTFGDRDRSPLTKMMREESPIDHMCGGG